MLNFLREWGVFFLIIILVSLSRLFIWFPVTVDGHSMDPTLASGQQLFVVKTAKIQRFDIVVANESENGQVKQIVKRVIGMPGDTITYQNDTLYINGKKTKEPYLAAYIKAFKKDKLQSTYSYNADFQTRATNSESFTTSVTASGEPDSSNFTITVPKGQYLLLGDNRIVSKDSREVGTFKRSAIVGEAKFRFWPIWPFEVGPLSALSFAN